MVKILFPVFLSIKYVVWTIPLNQSAENHRKECHWFWSRLRHSDSDFERSNISLQENKLDGVDLNSNGLDYCVRKNQVKTLWFSAD